MVAMRMSGALRFASVHASSNGECPVRHAFSATISETDRPNESSSMTNSDIRPPDRAPAGPFDGGTSMSSSAPISDVSSGASASHGLRA